MMLRIAAAVSLALGVAMFAVYLREMGRVPWSTAEARHLRRMKDRVTVPASYEAMDFAALQNLPRRLPRPGYAGIERRAVRVEGYVQRITRASDGDIHLDFAPSPPDSRGRLVPYVSAEITPQWHRGSRTWRFERLAALFRAPVGGRTAWEDGPRRVRLRGWLLYDYPYEGAAEPPGFPGHLAWWEIHPVTGIEYWDGGRETFVEYARATPPEAAR